MPAPRNRGNLVVGVVGKLLFGHYPGGTYYFPVWVWHKFAMPCVVTDPGQFPAVNDEGIETK